MLGTGVKKSNSNYCTFVAVVLLLLCLCVSSWGACYHYENFSTFSKNVGSGCANEYAQYEAGCAARLNSQYGCNSGEFKAGVSLTRTFCQYSYQIGCWGNIYCCGTQVEADSVACSQNCQAPNQCIDGVCTEPPKDSVKVCANETTCELGQGQASRVRIQSRKCNHRGT